VEFYSYRLAYLSYSTKMKLFIVLLPILSAAVLAAPVPVSDISSVNTFYDPALTLCSRRSVW
jgi:hypothetical protein